MARLGLDPSDKLLNLFLLEQSRNAGEMAGQFGLCKQGVNLAMANSVEQDCVAPTA
jgi:hypothetical protein